MLRKFDPKERSYELCQSIEKEINRVLASKAGVTQRDVDDIYEKLKDTIPSRGLSTEKPQQQKMDIQLPSIKKDIHYETFESRSPRQLNIK